MTNAMIAKDSKTKKKVTIIPFPTTEKETASEGSNIIRFDVFMEGMYAERADWKGRALTILGHIKACLFWEEMLISRKFLDKGMTTGFAFSHGTLLAENDQEQCRMKFQYHLMKSVRSACAFNAELNNNIGKRFITRKIKRSDETGPYNFCPIDSLKMVHDFEESFDDNWGGGASISSIRWDLKLKAHREQQELLAA